MLSSVLRTVRAHGLVAPGDRVLVAVSGGPDSMALLHALWELRDRLGIELCAVTVDHGLRPAARAEAELVAERAAALQVPWRLVHVDVAGARSGSLQDTARRLRLGALAELAAELGARRVALGHQADDQAETVLFRIVRGTGLHGLRGIPYRRDPFVRPLLDVPREQILRYLRRRSIGFAEDPSNADPRFARARVRHRLIPLLAEENPRVREALLGLAEAARRAPDGGAGEGALPGDIGRRAAAVVARLRAGRAGTRVVDVGGRRTVEISYGEVRVRPRVAAVASPAAVTVSGPGVYPWPGAGELVVRAEGPDVTAGACFDADAIRWPLSVRARRPGDRMRPRGGRGSRKLSDLLIDAKISRNERARLPVLLTADGVVLYVPGLRPAEHGRPSDSTKRLVHVHIDRHDGADGAEEVATRAEEGSERSERTKKMK